MTSPGGPTALDAPTSTANGGGRSRREKRTRMPTMADVAAIAGVSPQTVSRVLRGLDNVTEVTRLQVEAAVEQTGYRRTGLARALVTGRSRTIGVLTHETDYYARSSMMLGIQRATHQHDYFVSAAGTTSLSAASITDAIDRLRNQGVDGLVIAVPIWDEVSLLRVTADLPTVVIDGLESFADEIVRVDQEAAGRMATEHLLDLGHETVWHLSGPTAWKDAGGRTTGWQAALRDRGIDEPPVLYGDWSPESGYRNGLLLGRMPDVTAIFVSSDEMAFGVLRALDELGRSVPGDVSVIGMDDIALARYASPPLTTIRQPFSEMGRVAVEHLLTLIEEPAAERETVVMLPELIVRESTAAPTTRA
ncbi:MULTISPECIES: LacI family DNA-binding transcriptional regulator [Plantibacter]|uniref:LacI family DNA-binding transcriptional regulator n=1 Tax=Plantibacter TaxID=190323 RepID=UPI001E44C6FB|nr:MULTISPECIES: substrate-binding domain-containing protein [Plantibacter]